MSSTTTTTTTTLKQAALKPTTMDSIDSDNTLLINMMKKIYTYLQEQDITDNNNKNNKIIATTSLLQNAFKHVFKTQEELNSLVKFTFECRFGWSERKATTTTNDDPFNHGTLETSMSESQNSTSINDKDGSLASNRKRKLNINADKMIKMFREIQPSTRILNAIQYCVLNTSKPVVRKQVFIHFYDWFKSWVSKMYMELGKLNIYSDSDYQIMRNIIISSVTDIWSAIRKNAAVRLYSVVDLFPIHHVELLFQGLVNICIDNYIKGETEQATIADDDDVGVTTIKNKTQKSPWQAKEGALLGITAIVKKFRRVQTPSNSPLQSKYLNKTIISNKKKSKKNNNNNSGNDDDNNNNNFPTTTTNDDNNNNNKSLKKKKKPKGSPLSLQLNNLSFLSTNTFDDSNPPLSPTGTRQSFNMVTPVANRHNSFFNAMEEGTDTSSKDDKNKTTSTNALQTPKRNNNSDKKDNNNNNDIKTTATTPTTNNNNANAINRALNNSSPSSHATLTFGKDFICIGGLPDFIETEMQRVTYENLGHPQLTVRENATKAFAAFLSRSPSRQTLNAFSDVIGKLAKETEGKTIENSSNDGKNRTQRTTHTIPDPYLAEGLLSLCVILAKLRMVPEYYLKTNWNHIFTTLNKYLGHTASTVRQMSSTVFKHLAFKGSRSWSHTSDIAQQSPALLLLVLEGLVKTWKVDRELVNESNNKVQVINELAGDDFDDDFDDDEDEDEEMQLSWQSREGRLLTYELVIDYVLSNHANYIATDPSRKIYRRISSPPSIGGNINRSPVVVIGENVINRSKTSDIAGGTTGNNSTTAEKQPPKTPVRESPKDNSSSNNNNPLFASPAPSLPSPSPSPSANPWNSPPKKKSSTQQHGRSNSLHLNTGNSGKNTTSKRSPLRIEHISTSSSTNSSPSNTPTSADGLLTNSNRKLRNEPKSLLMFFMEASNLNKKNRNTTTITDTKTSASNTDIQHYLHHMILQTKECLMDDRFELTRMADQVLPGLVKLLCWIDVNILGKHWLSLGNSMRDKDALTCRFISSSLLVAIKYFISLRYMLNARQKSGNSRSRPNSPSGNSPMSKGVSTNNNNTAAVLNRSPTGTIGTGSSDKNKGKSGTKNTSNNMTTPPPQSSTTVTTPSSSYTPFTVVFKTKSTTQASKQASILQSILCDILPMFQRLANRAVTEKLFASTIEGMVILHSLFVNKNDKKNYDDKKMMNEQFVALDLRIPVSEAESIKHATIIVNRVVRIHTIAHPKHPQRAQTAHNRMVAMAAKEKRAQQLDNAAADALSIHIPGFFNRMANSTGCMDQVFKLVPIVLRWACSRDTIDAKCSLLHAVVDSINKIKHYIVDTETRRKEKLDEKVQGGDTIDDFDDDFDEENFDLEDDDCVSVIKPEQIEKVCLLSIAPLEKLLGTSAEASVLKSALQVTLALTMLGRVDIGSTNDKSLGDSIGSKKKNVNAGSNSNNNNNNKNATANSNTTNSNNKQRVNKSSNLLSRLLPVIAERLRQVAPRSVRISRSASMLFRGEQSIKLQLMSNEIVDDSHGNDDSQHLDSSTEDDGGDTTDGGNNNNNNNNNATIKRLNGGNLRINISNKNSASGLIDENDIDVENETVEENEATFNQDVRTNLRERSPSSGSSNNGISMFDDDDSSDNDDWDDWDDEAGGDTGNEALSNELGWFVHRLHLGLGGGLNDPLSSGGDDGGFLGMDLASNDDQKNRVLENLTLSNDGVVGVGDDGEDDDGLHGLGFVSGRDMEVLQWSLQIYNLK